VLSSHYIIYVETSRIYTGEAIILGKENSPENQVDIIDIL